MIDTGALTDLALTKLVEASLLVGDGIAPTNAGWSTGAPNVDRFLAYTVVAFEGAVPTMPDLGIRTDWDATFALRHYGGSRAQCDHQAKAARTAAEGLRHAQVGDFTIIGIQWRTLGALTRVDQVDPPYWNAYDYLVLTCSD